MNCPRCGSQRTKRERRKEGKGKKAVVTNLMEEWCEDCGWYGNHKVDDVSPDAGTNQATLFDDRED